MLVPTFSHVPEFSISLYNQEVFNYKIAARPERRRQFEKELTSQMEVALNILTACLNINELKEQVVNLFVNVYILFSVPFVMCYILLLVSRAFYFFPLYL